MQDGSAQRPAVPAEVLDIHPPRAAGPGSSDWRVAELALPGAAGDEGWVVLRVEPFEVMPLVEDAETAEMLAAMRARREGCSVWRWSPEDGWQRAADQVARATVSEQ